MRRAFHAGLLVAFALLGGYAAAGEPLDVGALQESELVGEPFLALIEERGAGALCALRGVRDCLKVTDEACARALARGESRCIDNVRRLVRVTGVTDKQLNRTFFADYAACLMDGAAMARLLDLESARTCIAAASPAMAQLLDPEPGMN